jgi:ATP-dependent DNA ligase
MDFRALLAGKGWLRYAAFDVLWLNWRDLRAQPLIKRKRRLELAELVQTCIERRPG